MEGSRKLAPRMQWRSRRDHRCDPPNPGPRRVSDVAGDLPGPRQASAAGLLRLGRSRARQEVARRELLSHLRRWARPGGRTPRADDQPGRRPGLGGQLISGLVLAEFVGWDGALRDASGRRRAEIALNVFVSGGGRRCEIYYVPKQPEGFPDVDRRWHPAGPGGDGWYRPLPRIACPMPSKMEYPWSLTTAVAPSRSSPADHPLHQSFNAGLGGWLSVRRIRFTSPSGLPSTAIAWPACRTSLRRAGSAGSVRAAEGLPSDWLLLVDAIVTSGSRRPGQRGPGTGADSPRMATTMAFDGGLALERDCYLSGEEPVVHLGLEEPGFFQLDGDTQALAAGGLSLPLSDMRLGPGRHWISLGATSRGFMVSLGEAGQYRRRERTGFCDGAARTEETAERTRSDSRRRESPPRRGVGHRSKREG